MVSPFKKNNSFLLLFALLTWCCTSNQPARILVFSKTMGFRHASIPEGIVAIQKLGRLHHFEVDTTEDASKFNEENLKRYSAVIFLSTTGDVLNTQQQNDFERFIQAGGGFVGIHAAADTEYDWPWYGKLVGAYFDGHPSDPNVRKGVFYVVDKHHPATDSLPEKWVREDEFYSFKQINPDIRPLIKIDEKSYGGGKNGDDHPMAWYHEFDGGRCFYTNMGHTPETFADPLFLKHLWGGIYYVLGEKELTSLNYTKVHTQRPPDENRFSIVVLDEKLDEPMELTVLPGNRVLFIERKGAVKIYDPARQKTKLIATIPVNTKYLDQKEAEDGLLGVAKDPHFEKNNWVYFYYAKAGEEAKNILTRYELRGDELVDASKKVLLEVVTQREQCCHTGGSIAFDGNGNLFVSTGDNTNPFGTGYSPADERPGRSPWDAQKSSASPNDLRGKILRIHPEENGTYTIPDGNLFPKGTAGTRPEIYVMGNRNPFRISVDKKSGYVYWGEVGPDAGKDSLERGSKGMDEVNQARKPGFFGWPYFVGDNKPYHKIDFVSGKSGPPHDPLNPVNNSPNNSGIHQLPPAQKAFIWYPYDASPEFPMVGTGGRTAMAGPVFYSEDFSAAPRPFPEYYDSKLLIYEWMRGWIMAVTMDKEGNYVSMERFMPSHKFSNPMDMEFSPDGDLYLLEYGTAWFHLNDDARLVKIVYNGGNRKPQVHLAFDKSKGAIPLMVHFSSRGTSDPDRDELKYEWKFLSGDGSLIKTLLEPNPAFTFDKAGIYKTLLTVTDARGELSTADAEIVAGNEPPSITLSIIRGNTSFFFQNQPIEYDVSVHDAEDGTLESGGILAGQVSVKIDYLKDGFEAGEVALGHRMGASVKFAGGKKLMDASDCKSCHMSDQKSIGPMYKQVAAKYKGDKGAVDKLARKVINGGGGVWGATAMAAHPQLSPKDATEIVNYILSLSDNEEASLPGKGSYTLKIPKGESDQGVLLLNASYTDRGAGSIPSITEEKLMVLRSPKMAATEATFFHGAEKFKVPDGDEIVIGQRNNAFIGFQKIDLTEISQLQFIVQAPDDQLHAAGGSLEIHIDSPTGPLIGKTMPLLPAKGLVASLPPVIASARITATRGVHDLYLVFKNEKSPAGQPLFVILNVQFYHI